MEQKPTPHDEQYFVMGNNKIIVKEHFKEDGKPLISIVEKLILDEAVTDYPGIACI